MEGGPKWESVYVEKVICCQRVVSVAFEMKGERKTRGPEYGNTRAERHFQPGGLSCTEIVCGNCPTTKIGRITVYPITCSRPEAKVDA